jgi:hypothetical protein
MIALCTLGWLLVAAKCHAETNSVGETPDFYNFVARAERNRAASIRRDKDGAVVYIGFGELSDDDLLLISEQPSVRELVFYAPKVTDRGVAALQCMTNLISLTIARSNAIPVASELGELQHLNLWCSKLKPSDLPYLMKMTNLVELNARGAYDLGPGGIIAMTNLTHLKKLVLGGGWNSDTRQLVELTALSNLTSLEELDLYGFLTFGDEQLRQLASFPNLKTLELDGVNVSDNWSNIVSQFPVLTNAVVSVSDDPQTRPIKKPMWTRGR